MFSSQQQIMHQLQELQPEGKKTPAADFPQMICPEHKSPVILVSPKPDVKCGIFLCSKCVANNSQKLQELQPLMTWEEFVKYISEPCIITSPKTFNEQILEQKTSNIGSYMSHVNSQKYEVKLAIDKLQKLYQDKCEDLVANIQETLEAQKEIFDEHYSKFEQEVKCDPESDASVPKFSQIKAKMLELQTQEEIEEYMRQVLRKKQAWQAASDQMKSLGQRSLDYYYSIIQEQMQKKPSFVKAEKILELWTSGLNNLISIVKQESECFEGLYKFTQGIELEIKNAEELKLLTSKMVKKDTVLKLILKQQKITEEQAQAIGKCFENVPNLNHLIIDLEQAEISAGGLREILCKLQIFKELECLDINLYAVSLKNEGFKAVAEAVAPLASLKYLRMNLGRCDLNDEAAKAISEAVGKLEGLKCIDIQLNFNSIQNEGAIAWSQAIQNLKKLTYLSLNLAGFSSMKNKIKEQGASAVFKAIGFLCNLEELTLNFGHTELVDSSIIDLANSIKLLSKVNFMSLDLFSNKIGEKGVSKLSKAISKCQKLTKLTLNLNNNSEIKKDGAKEIVNSLKKMSKLTTLEMNLRSTGVSKEEG